MDISSLNNESVNGKNTGENTKNKQPVETSFQETIDGFFNEINELQTKASDSIENFATEKVENVHEVMIAMSKAEDSFKCMMQTRNKLIETFKEVMRSQD